MSAQQPGGRGTGPERDLTPNFPCARQGNGFHSGSRPATGLPPLTASGSPAFLRLRVPGWHAEGSAPWPSGPGSRARLARPVLPLLRRPREPMRKAPGAQPHPLSTDRTPNPGGPAPPTTPAAPLSSTLQLPLRSQAGQEQADTAQEEGEGEQEAAGTKPACGLRLRKPQRAET